MGTAEECKASLRKLRFWECRIHSLRVAHLHKKLKISFPCRRRCRFSLKCVRLHHPRTRPVRTTGAGFWEPVGCQIFIFFKCFFNTFQEPQKIDLTSLQEHLEPTWPFLEPNLASKTDPKSTLFRVQEATYVKTRENPKLDESSRDGPHFCFPRASQNPPKIDEKSIPRGFYVKLVF